MIALAGIYHPNVVSVLDVGLAHRDLAETPTVHRLHVPAQLRITLERAYEQNRLMHRETGRWLCVGAGEIFMRPGIEDATGPNEARI